MSDDDINTHNVVVDFGRHKGTPYTRMPIGYLKWMVNSAHSKQAIAAAELKRRGTITPELDLSGHAIDRASTNPYTMHRYKETMRPDEGIYSWLARMAAEARAHNDVDHKGRFNYAGLRFAFEEGQHWPVLKTVMPAKGDKAFKPGGNDVPSR